MKTKLFDGKHLVLFVHVGLLMHDLGFS